MAHHPGAATKVQGITVGTTKEADFAEADFEGDSLGEDFVDFVVDGFEVALYSHTRELMTSF